MDSKFKAKAEEYEKKLKEHSDFSKEKWKKYERQLQQLKDLELQREQEFFQGLEQADIPWELQQKWNQIMEARQKINEITTEYFTWKKNSDIELERLKAELENLTSPQIDLFDLIFNQSK